MQNKSYLNLQGQKSRSQGNWILELNVIKRTVATLASTLSSC